MMREIEQFYSTQIEEMPMLVPNINYCYSKRGLIVISRNVADLI